MVVRFSKVIYVNYFALHRQTAVSDYLKSKQLLLFVFALAKLTYSHDGEMLRRWPNIETTLVQRIGIYLQRWPTIELPLGQRIGFPE